MTKYILVHYSEDKFSIYPDTFLMREYFHNHKIFDLDPSNQSYLEKLFSKENITECNNNAVVILIKRVLNVKQADRLLNFMFENFKLSNKYISDVISTYLDFAFLKNARNTFDFAKQNHSFNDDNLLHELEHCEESDILNTCIYPLSVPINERYIKPRLVLNKYNDINLTKWMPGSASYYFPTSEIILNYIDGDVRSSYTHYVAQYSIEEWFNLTGENFDVNKELTFVEIGYYHDNINEVDRIFIDKSF